MLTMEQVQSAVRRMGDLPTLPNTLSEFNRVASDPNRGVHDLVEIITRDPALSSKVLRIVNSAFLGLQEPVSSLRFALVIMGTRHIRQLVTGVCVMSMFPVRSGRPSFDRHRFWEHCSGTGTIARTLAQQVFPNRFEGEEFTAGLLHDVGKIVLDQYFHDNFAEAFAVSREKNIPLVEAERSTMGVTHTEVGRWVAESWNLPPDLTEAIEWHHQPLRAQRNPVLVALVHVGDLLAKAKDIGFSGDRSMISLTDDEGWKILEREQPRIGDLDLVRMTHELDTDIERAREFMKLSL